MISFLYTGSYCPPPANGLLHSDNGTCALQNAFAIPDPTSPTPETTVLLDALRHTFHLHMYALASTLHYPTLRIFAREKLWDILHGIMRPSTAMGARWILRECIDACYSPLPSDARFCADDDGLLRETIVAAVLAHEVRTWNKAQREGLRAYLTGPPYAGFWDVYHGVTAENAELLAPACEGGDTGQKRVGVQKTLQAKKEEKSDEAQKRRDRKEHFRKGLGLIEKQETADLAVVMAANPMQTRDDAIECRYQGDGDGLQLPAATVPLTYRIREGGMQQNTSGERAERPTMSEAQVAGAAPAMNDKVFDVVDKGRAMARLAGIMGLVPAQNERVLLLMHDEGDDETEMQDGMRRMYIDDRA